MVILDKLTESNSIKSIFFDIDGTITRWKDVRSFLTKALRELDMPYKEEYLSGLYKAMKLNDYNTLTSGLMDEDAYANLLGIYISDLKNFGLTGKDLKNKMFELEASQTYIDDDVYEELTHLQSEYHLYCYTNWFKIQAMKKLEYHNLDKFFLAVHTPEDMFIKQSSIAYQYLLEKYRLKPEETLFIGDSKTDIVPSKKVGIKTIYINYDIKTEDDINASSMELINASDASITKFSDIHVVLSKKY
ncbi:MAG: HAD family hydrolase [Erysipelotrichales bacterium]|nr:HAD family hydrolase [Erysipelotrichales bacterium]